MRILAIDPGTAKTGWVLFESNRVIESGVDSNEDVLELIDTYACQVDEVAIEVFQAMGMPVGAEVFETCYFIGRVIERVVGLTGNEPLRVFRKQVKINLCGTMKAKDANIRQSLIDRLGPPGTKAAKGPTYGVTSHSWSALGIAVTAYDSAMGVV